jgi:hypothetical protein
MEFLSLESSNDSSDVSRDALTSTQKINMPTAFSFGQHICSFCLCHSPSVTTGMPHVQISSNLPSSSFSLSGINRPPIESLGRIEEPSRSGPPIDVEKEEDLEAESSCGPEPSQVRSRTSASLAFNLYRKRKVLTMV